MKNLITKLFMYVYVLGLILLSGCTGQEKSSSIIIPPGAEVQYSNSEFIQISQEYYSVELKAWDKVSKKFISVENLTPKENKSQIQKINYIIPKDKDSQAFYIIEVQMIRAGLTLQAIVTPGTVTAPDLATTLLVELLSKYPNKDISESSIEFVNAADLMIRKRISSINENTHFPEDVTLQSKYKFYRNFFSADYDFLELLDKNKVSFDYTNKGIVKTEPFPFGRKNISPSLDSSNSTSLSREVRGAEKNEVSIKGFGIDAENDFILYQWYKDGIYYGFNPKEFRWVPDFNDSKIDPYKIKLVISDGGPAQEYTWNVIIDNMNRKPYVTKTCTETVKEWQTYSCKISAVDFDGEPMSFTVSDSGTSARVKMNGQGTDDSTRKLTLSNLSEVTIELTPNNEDALRRSAYIELSVNDMSGGSEIVPLNIFIEDINSAPDIIGSYKTITLGGGQHEWDYCANQDPDGKAPYFFSIEVRDPDNQPLAFPRSQHPDTVQVNVAGTLADKVNRIDDPTDTVNYAPGACPLSSSEVMYFCYVWRPTQTEKSGTLTFTMKDNHGGISPLKIINITAEDRNQKPCLGNIGSVSVLDEMKLSREFKNSANDADSDLPFMTMVNVRPEVMPFLVDCSASSKPIITRESFIDKFFSGKVYRTSNGAGGAAAQCTRANYFSPYAGAVTFSRNSPFGTDVLIPAGYSIETNYATSNVRVKYTVAAAVTMGPNDKSIMVPISATDRLAGIGEIRKITSNVPAGFIPPADLLVNNASSLADRGNVVLSRTNSAAELVLPTGILIRSDETLSPTQSTFQYVTTKRYKMAAGVTSLTVPVVRKNIDVPANSLTVLKGGALADATVAITNESKISSENNYTLSQLNQTGITSNVDRFCWNLWAEDGYSAPANSVKFFTVASPAAGLTVTNPQVIQLSGEVVLSRTDTASTLTIPANTLLQTANGTIFSSTEIRSFAVGQSSLSVSVNRYNHVNPLPITGTTEILSGTLNQFLMAKPQADLTVVNPTNLYQMGSVVFSRSNTTTALTIPINTILKTASNFQFKTTTLLEMEIGQSSGYADVINVSPASITYNTDANKLCAGFSDMNYIPKFITSTTTSTVEGTNTTGFLIEVNDNIADPDFPNDPSDRHTFTFTSLGTAPGGNIKFCREPGDNPADIDSPACTSCATPVSADYWDSARCYVRFAPNILHDSTSDITKTFSYLVNVNDNGMATPANTNTATQTLSITVAEVNDPPVATDLTWAPLIGNTHLNPIDLGNFTEGSLSEYFIYASDSDRLTNNKKIVFSLESTVYDVQTSTWVTRPSGASVGVDTPNDDPFGNTWGSRYRGKISWSPTDADAKKFASPSGIVFKVKVSDSSGTGVFNYAYYKVRVTNINQLPFLNAVVNLNMAADTYVSNTTSIVISDKDFASVGAPVNFQTSLSLCNSTAIVNCPAPLTGWPVEISVYDASYTDNSAVTSCRSGSLLNTSLALPRLTRATSPTLPGDRISYAYKFEWCPQKGHIGSYTAFLNMKDNGDKDRNNVALPSQEVMAPFTLKIVAPVFFVSPGRDSTGTVVHFMKRAFVGRPYTYKTIIKNSKGNAVTYSLLAAPTGMTVNSTGIVSWTPTAGQVTSTDSATWPVVQLRVRDNVTGEIDTVSYRVEVKSPLSPVQASPVIVDKDPVSTPLSSKERVRRNFSLLASDSNNDPLFYRWYVDSVLVYDKSATYEYFPGVEDGYTDPDGTNSLRPGQHTITVEVTDSYDTKSFSWLVNVKNTVPSPVLAFNLLTYVTGITQLVWGPEAGVALTSGATTVNSLIFSGSYRRSSRTKNYLYNLIFQNGLFTASTSTVKSMEVLQWAAGTTTERISWEPLSGTNFNILLTSQINREGPFSSLTNAERLPSSLGMTSVNASHLCNGTCPLALYSSADSYGYRPSAVWSSGSSYIFTASNSRDALLWDRDGAAATTFYSLTGNLRVGSLAVNPGTKRLYATIRDVGAQLNRILVFDIYPVTSGVSPTLVATLNVFDGVTADNRILDLAVVPSLNKIFALLPGTGGLAVLTDNGTAVPIDSDISFVGVTEIGSSYSDIVGNGRKLVYNSSANLLYGISKDSNQMFSIDPSTMELKVYASSITGGFDSILTFNNDNLTIGISKTLGQVFIVK